MRGTIIFDLDGTLADSFAFVSRFIAQKGGESGLTLAERRRQFQGLTMRGMAGKLGISLRRQLWLFFYGRRQMTKQIGRIKPFEDVEDVIKSLHSQGYALYALSSNRNKNIQLFFRRYGLAQYFTATQGSASLLGKTLALCVLLWRHDLRAADCFYVGDEAGDLKAARRLHIHAIGVTWGYNELEALSVEKPYAIAKTPDDLVKIFAGIRSDDI